MKDSTIVLAIVIVFFLVLGVVCLRTHQKNQEYTKQMKENAEKFHEEAVKARQEDLKAGEELQEKYDKEFWNNTKNNNLQE